MSAEEDMFRRIESQYKARRWRLIEARIMDRVLKFDLSKFDLILINTSGGKDSQCMAWIVWNLAVSQGVEDRVHFVHADLDRVEWPGTKVIAIEQAKQIVGPMTEDESASFVGSRFHLIRSHDKDGQVRDLLTHTRARRAMLDSKGKHTTPAWPAPTNRWCTSDHKRGPILKVITKLTPRRRSHMKWNVLNCMGMRAEESPARSKLLPFERSNKSNGVRTIWNWLPIHLLSVSDVWQVIRASDVTHHYAYDNGFPRVSCVFCIYGRRDIWEQAALKMKELGCEDVLNEYVRIEEETGHSFHPDVKLADIKRDLDAGKLTKKESLADWRM